MPNLETLYITLTKKLHYIYLLFVIPMVYIAVSDTPPFQNPDEPNHFARAEQVSRFELVPRFVHGNSLGTDTLNGGFKVDQGVYQTSAPFFSIAHQVKVKVTPDEFSSVKDIKWGTSLMLKNFANTAIYAPVGYIMPALGILMGKAINLSVIKTFYLARILNAICSIVLCFIALRLAKRSKIMLFTALLFPMTLAMFASVSQDAVLISCAFLLISLIDNTESTESKPYSKNEQIIMILLVSVISLAKPPYLPLVLIFPFLRLDRRLKIISIAIPCVIVALWLFVISPNFAVKLPEAELSFNPKLQVAHIIDHPFKFIGLFFSFNPVRIINNFNMFVGILGWLDTSFSFLYYQIAYLICFLALLGYLNLEFRDKLKLRSGLFLTALVTLMAVMTGQYIVCTALDATYLGGMQGRYLIPIFPFMALALCMSSAKEEGLGIKALLLLPILAFPVFTIINLVNVLHNRYW